MQIHSELPVDPELARRLGEAKGREMTPAERYEQRISFAYGNLPAESTLTKDDVRREAERLYGPPPKETP